MAIEYKRLAAAAPSDTNEAELYAVPTGSEIIANLVVTNLTASPVTFRVAHTDTSGAAAAEDWLAYDESLPMGSRLTIPITAKNPETIRIQAGTANALTFHLAGMLKS